MTLIPLLPHSPLPLLHQTPAGQSRDPPQMDRAIDSRLLLPPRAGALLQRGASMPRLRFRGRRRVGDQQISRQLPGDVLRR